jgi:hypothetical protein
MGASLPQCRLADLIDRYGVRTLDRRPDRVGTTQHTRWQDMTIHRYAPLAVATALLAGGSALPSHAEGGRTVRVVSQLHGVQDAVPDGSVCAARGGEYVPGPTDLAYSGVSTYTGTFEGTGRFCGYIPPRPNADGSLSFVETDVFTGLVRGCGRGSITYVVHGFIYPSVDLTRRSLDAAEDWVVVARTGTQGLRGLLSGRGHDPAWVNADDTVDADFRGTVRCVPGR